VLGDSNRPRRVFLSHTTELSRFPKGHSFVAAAVSAVNRGGHSPVDMAQFTASDRPPSTVVYLVGPLIGGIAAAFIYDRFLAKAKAPA
jgi:hypothetical protein